MSPNPIHAIRKTLWVMMLASLCFTGLRAQVHQSSSDGLPVSTPEKEGVSSAGILKFLDAVDKGNNELHSFVLVRHGKVISSGWWSPYGKEWKHTMYSVSKSFTSIGVGLAISENKLKLADQVQSFFPESLPDTMSQYMKGMTVEDLLKMSAGMETDPLFNARSATNWPRAFLSSRIENKPGSVFKYNNMATFMLSAIVQKATGQKLVDSLKPRLFEPLAIGNYTWDETPEGYTFGAIGLRIQSDDMAKFGQMLLQNGKWKGKQVVPASWVEQATSFQIMSNAPENKRPRELNDWQQGYGYQFWRGRNNTYRADGLGGQFIIVVPDKDAVVVLTAASANTQEELDLVWDHLLPAMQDHPLATDKKATAELTKRAASLSVPGNAVSGPTAWPARMSGKKIEVAQNETGIRSLTLILKGGEGHLLIDRETEHFDLPAGLDRWKFSQTRLNTLSGAPRPNQVLPINVASKYTWTDPSTLTFTSRFVEDNIRSESWMLHFDDAGAEIKVHIEIKTYVEFAGIKSRTLEGVIK